ncbi:MAG: dihydrolipoyl dehydrogenase [Phycisphaeraceae bacterium]|nr:dihydrolipoyl dehydrogenase [Phycisphaeraceae bacterium]
MVSTSKEFDLVIIGGGPAGYIAAIRASQLGMNVACVERDRLGGVCLNWGCIPTKALLAGAEFYHRLKHESADWGILADKVSHDWSKVIGRSRNVASTLNKGVHGLFKKNKISHFEGHARIVKPGVVEVYEKPEGGEVKEKLKCSNILIATGAVPRELPGTPFDGKTIISSKEAMTLEDQPEELLIVGAGAIGMEFAYFYNAFGTKVTIVEMLDRLLPIEDEEVSKAIEKSFKKQGIKIYTGHKTTEVKKTDDGVEITIEDVKKEGKTTTLKGGKLLVAIGVRGRYDGLFDDSLGIKLFKDHIKVNRDTYQTSVRGIYAVGDVNGPPWLAHVASEEAVVCVEKLAGHKPAAIDYDSVPGCTYCHPQVASLGKTEQKLREEGLEAGKDYKVGKFPFMASGKAQAMGSTEGFVKIIKDAKYGEILGVHMIGENVTELLAEMGLARRLEATAEEVIHTMHAHPTLSEAIHEAALATESRTLNF